MYKCLKKFLSSSILSVNRNIFDRKNYSDTLVSITLFFYPPFSFWTPLFLSLSHSIRVVQVDRARPILVSPWGSVFLLAQFSYGSFQAP